MYCSHCGIYNDEDSTFCKSCGSVLREEENNNNDSSKKQVKRKTKKETRKEKKQRNKRIKKQKKVKNVNKNKKGMTIGQKILMGFLFLLIIILIGALAAGGYYYYTQQTVTVPNVVDMSYNDAQIKIVESGFKVSKNEKNTSYENQNNIVLGQSKKAGKKAAKGSTIKLTVGKYEKTYTLPDFTDMQISSVKAILSNEGIKYSVTYQTVTNQKGNIVLSQSPKANTEIKTTETVKLVVSNNEDTSTNTTPSKETTSSTSTDSSITTE